MKSPHTSRLPATLLALPIVLAMAAMATSTVLGDTGAPTKGTLENAFDVNGQIDVDLAPDFIAAVGPDGERVGYVTRDDALELGPVATDADGRPVDLPIAVYAEDLETVVGHFYPARGFVPLGTDPDAVPTIEVWSGPADPVSD